MDALGEDTLMKKIALSSVYSHDPNSYHMYIGMLYALLEQRKPNESISHKKMPTLVEHTSFIANRPYEAWYVIHDMGEVGYPVVGAVYLNLDDSIGISIYDRHKRQGYASAAIKELMNEHPRNTYWANINPENHKSKDLFTKLGFKFYKSEKHQDVYVYLPNQEE